MRLEMDQPYGKAPYQLLDWYLPDEEGFDIVIWFHGGGIEQGSRKGGKALAQQAVANGYGFVSVCYKLYPEARFPEFLLDAAAAVAFVIKEMEQYGGRRVIVSGGSAGAYLIMMLALNKAYLRNAGADRSRILAFVSDSAQMTTHFNVLRERGQDSRLERIDDAAPLYYSGVFPQTEPLLLISYENDMECRLEQNRLMLRSLRRFNPETPIELVVLPGGHCAGSTKVNEEGAYPFLVEMFSFVKKL